MADSNDSHQTHPHQHTSSAESSSTDDHVIDMELIDMEPSREDDNRMQLQQAASGDTKPKKEPNRSLKKSPQSANPSHRRNPFATVDRHAPLPQRLLLRIRIKLYNFVHYIWWLLWSTSHFIYHHDTGKSRLIERHLFLNRTVESLVSAFVAFVVLYAVFFGVLIAALECLSLGMWGNSQFDLFDKSAIPKGNPNYVH